MLLLLWPRVVARRCTDSEGLRLRFCYPTQTFASECLVLWSNLNSDGRVLQGASHAVEETLCSRAHRIWMDRASCLLRALVQSRLLRLFDRLHCWDVDLARFEFVVALEENLQSLGNDVGRGGVDELRVLVELGFHRLLDSRLNRYRLRLFGWCLNDRHVLVSFLLVGFVIRVVLQIRSFPSPARPKHDLRLPAERGGSDPRSPEGSGRDFAARWGRSRLCSCFGRASFPCRLRRICLLFLRVILALD